MRNIIVLMGIVFLFGCSSGKVQYNEDKLVKIYSAVELEPIDKAAKIMEEYQLDKVDNREAYYDAIRELNTDKEKWEAFLKKVEEYRRVGNK